MVLSMILETNLFDYQKKAYDKLIKLKVGALYMEMGTGKTRVALEIIKDRIDKNKIDYVIWLCPFSTKKNLEEEIKKHTKESDFIYICGIETLSTSIKENSKLLDLVINRKVFLIVDESNLVKNHHAKRTNNIIRLSEKCKYKLILNGTPITKNEKDLFSQWYILDWRILGYRSFYTFARNHLEYDDRGQIRDTINVDYLINKIALYSYQVKKDECLNLKQKKYETYTYFLNDEQCEHYNSVADELLFQIDEYKPSTIYRLFNGLQCVVSGFQVQCCEPMKKHPWFDDPFENPRIQKLLEIVESTGNEKYIIFAKYVQEIEDLIYVLNKTYGYNSAVGFYGEISKKNRDINREDFKLNNNVRFFVSNKTCGGYGLNLQFCSKIIFYSNDFNYATRAQAEDRVHRLGQTDNVEIIDICCHQTIDKRILKSLWNKESLVDTFKRELKHSKDKKYDDFYIRKDSYGNKFKLVFNEQIDNMTT
jgi:SNF2 family DNA or RNA helicase